MPDISSLYPSVSLKTEDVKKGPLTLTITGLTSKTFDDGKTVPILMFQEEERGFRLNKTNAMIIADAYGSNTDNWIGQRIQLRAGRTMFSGKMVDTINVVTPRRAPQRPVAQPSQQFDDRNIPLANSPDEFGADDNSVPF